MGSLDISAGSAINVTCSTVNESLKKTPRVSYDNVNMGLDNERTGFNIGEGEAAGQRFSEWLPRSVKRLLAVPTAIRV